MLVTGRIRRQRYETLSMSNLNLITGAAGLIGSHLLDALVSEGERVLATYFRPTVPLFEVVGKAECIELDVRVREAVRNAIAHRRPEVIYHLAAQSLPTESWRDPWYTMDVNVVGTVNLFEAIKEARGIDRTYDPVVVVACSSAEYGASLTPERIPVDESAPLMPLHPYGVSKVAQDGLAFQYWFNDGIRSIRARIFNTTGPRKANDVVSDFATRVARIAIQGGTLRVGNLETRRAFLDVRDCVSALRALAHRGRPGEVYNISGERAYAVRELIPMFEVAAGLKLTVEQDAALLRPSDEAVIFGRSDRIKGEANWRPTIELERTVADTFNYECKRRLVSATA
jgi:GDP-4-dehydro-6-deoxy-D-mannose reductase